jgi:prepilin-type N-terminal cleavage/methylation domain-containing protein
MSRLRQEGGFTVIELLVVVSLMAIVLGATLGPLEGFATRSHRNEQQNETQTRARMTMDRLTRQVRNLAKPTSAIVKSIDKAEDYDLVFQTVDPNKRRVRYCLDTADPGNATLYLQTQAFPTAAADPGVPSSAACPAALTADGWESREVVSDHVVNTRGGADRDVFYYTGLGGDGDTAKITQIRSQVFVDVNGTKAPGEVSVTSGVYLRNQNQNPAASFEVKKVIAPRTFIFNASQSSDPEGRTLDFRWYTGDGADLAKLPACDKSPDDSASLSGSGFAFLNSGLTLTHTFPSTVTGTVTVTLKVCDPGGLSATDQDQAVIG